MLKILRIRILGHFELFDLLFLPSMYPETYYATFSLLSYFSHLVCFLTSSSSSSFSTIPALSFLPSRRVSRRFLSLSLSSRRCMICHVMNMSPAEFERHLRVLNRLSACLLTVRTVGEELYLAPVSDPDQQADLVLAAENLLEESLKFKDFISSKVWRELDQKAHPSATE